MLRLNERQRAVLADKSCDTANLALGALGFGQLLGERFSFGLALVGLVMWLALIGVSIWLMEETQ